MRRRMNQAHNGQLWERLYQLIKVESPITFGRIKHWCPDVRACELESTLREMCQARRVSVMREWRRRSLIETYHYGVCEGAGVILADDEAGTLSSRAWYQLRLVA